MRIPEFCSCCLKWNFQQDITGCTEWRFFLNRKGAQYGPPRDLHAWLDFPIMELGAFPNYSLPYPFLRSPTFQIIEQIECFFFPSFLFVVYNPISSGLLTVSRHWFNQRRTELQSRLGNKTALACSGSQALHSMHYRINYVNRRRIRNYRNLSYR